MNERRDAIVRLLCTLTEGLPLPVHRSEASSGFVHRAPAQLVCPDCLANDAAPRSKVMKSCETCKGKGFVEEVRERDPYAIGAILPYGFSVDRHELARERDRQLDRLERQLARPGSAEDELAEANAHPWPWELARKRMYSDFDYSALDRELELLRATDVDAYHALHAVYVYGYMPHRFEPRKEGGCAVCGEREGHAGHGESPEALLERGLAFLAERLPDPLSAPAPPPVKRVRGPLHAKAGAGAKEFRDEEMRQRAREGARPEELVRLFGVSLPTVYRVVNAA